MDNGKRYIFKSERLGFRDWLSADIAEMSSINADRKVMEFFPSLQSEQQTIDFIGRMQKQFSETGYCYFAVDSLQSNDFIGFIGISDQTFESDFTPCIDIGWRLKSTEWNKGLATEGAKRCLEYAFNDLGIKKINSIAPSVNIKSEKLMNKIGMTKVKTFIHPKLTSDQRLQKCVLYEIMNY